MGQGAWGELKTARRKASRVRSEAKLKKEKLHSAWSIAQRVKDRDDDRTICGWGD